MDPQIIYDYGKNPSNYGPMDDADFVHHEVNHTCGEEIKLFLKFKKQQGTNPIIIDRISFEAEGRMITFAAMSFLTEHMEDREFAHITEVTGTDILNMLEATPDELSSKRLKSAMLCLLTFTNTYKTYTKEALIELEDILATIK